MGEDCLVELGPSSLMLSVTLFSGEKRIIRSLTGAFQRHK